MYGTAEEEEIVRSGVTLVLSGICSKDMSTACMFESYGREGTLGPMEFMKF